MTDRGPAGAENGTRPNAEFSALLEDSAEDLYENAPCGYLSTLMDGSIAKVNATLLSWLGRDREEVVGRLRFADLLTVGGRLYHETHFAPLLRMRGEVRGIALEVVAADGSRLPVLATSRVKVGDSGEPLLIRTTLTDARDRRAYETELLRARRSAEEARGRAEADRARLQEALAVLQQSLLPPTLPRIPGLDAAAYYHAASPDRLGGDFYDLFPLDRRRWAFFLGDVCGKGPEAAAVTALARHTLRATVLHEADPVHVLSTLNTTLFERFADGDPRYCTAVFGVLTPDGAGFTVDLAGGGHPPALVTRTGGRADFLPTPGGLLVGALPQAHFVTARTRLLPGDALLLYTDGITEARTGADRALFGEDALRAFAAERTDDGPHALVAALTDLLAGFGDGLVDDTALLCLGVPAAAAADGADDGPPPGPGTV